MKKTWMLLMAVVLIVAALGAPMLHKAAASERPAQVLRHVVLFQFKDGTTPEQVRTIENAFCRLPSATGVIYDFEWGTNVSVENLDQGFTHCFFLTFKNEEDRAAYLPHPAHKEFGTLLGPHLEKALVVDYWTRP